MTKEVYVSVSSMTPNVVDAEGFIEDGSQLFLENGKQFEEWLAEVNRRISPHGRYKDESSCKKNKEFINFLSSSVSPKMVNYKMTSI